MPVVLWDPLLGAGAPTQFQGGWAATSSLPFLENFPQPRGDSRPWKVMLHLTLHSGQWLTHTVGNSSPLLKGGTSSAGQRARRARVTRHQPEAF